ncbi:FliH/SctL family protein [Polymorphobacter fuscus]|nr:FliH/SctL family protein [Polymorphobacter fuscus]NJC07887.1 flagellar biosynthesis/type III secretory pathway protein FliH [Polymorphobacter fuscus]
MLDAALPPGLAGLLSALQPRAEAPPLPDLDAIREGGWAAGYAAGEIAATAALAPLRDRLAAAAAALDAAQAIDADRLRPLFAALVQQIAEAVLMAELASGASVLVPLVEAALAAVRPGEAPVLRAHPDTLAALQPYLASIATMGDTAMARDAFAVSAPDLLIDAGLSTRLATIIGGLA